MNDDLQAFGLHWRVGRNWGVAHPEETCYADVGEVTVSSDRVRLGIALKPQTFHDRTYPWAIGYISSLESFKYGIFDFVYQLPLGMRLWPAIWLCDRSEWPPEIDIMEAWSGRSWLSRHIRRDYAGLPLMSWMHPGIFHGTNADRRNTAGGWFNGRYTPSLFIDERGVNYCRLLWAPDRVEVYYNGRLIWRCIDGTAMADLRKSSGMEVHLQNCVQSSFTYDDYASLVRRDFSILDFNYKQI